ncbi:VOC family protein [Cronbergia sp. UHCC 0137]|uniref:VOC family protein n=1 Tax=Cronbergia sp. UHCC 0137 TaxID=3110239 RepID=UPI002B221007|nr:VOC family protein [Cronbergia sp. UHCC 0137]MEA5619485.1 VOC family protein [Cronbergia sp. UHCC 0137]
MTQEQTTAIKGIYEVCIGVPEAITAVKYWEQFGYRVGQLGDLDASAANKLYGVNSPLQAIRLYHQGTDHGLIRLMIWQNPTNAGLGISTMKVKGNRWATTLTTDLLGFLNHVEEAKIAGWTIKYSSPYWEVIYAKEKKSRPFVEPVAGVREMLVLQPLTRQVLFQRFGYVVPNYGSVNHNAAFSTSQFTHVGLIVQDDSKEILRFYEEVLGLLRVRDDVETTYESSEAGRDIFDLGVGEKYIVTAFDDPRSSQSNFLEARSGRLYIIRFPEEIKVESRFEAAQPGSLGMCLYTYRVQGIETYFQRVQSSMAKQVTDIICNEFGEVSFSFISPDGYFWTLLERGGIAK